MELLEWIGELIVGMCHILLDIAEDRGNRNDRGKLKRASEKYVTR